MGTHKLMAAETWLYDNDNNSNNNDWETHEEKIIATYGYEHNFHVCEFSSWPFFSFIHPFAVLQTLFSEPSLNEKKREKCGKKKTTGVGSRQHNITTYTLNANL